MGIKNESAFIELSTEFSASMIIAALLKANKLKNKQTKKHQQQQEKKALEKNSPSRKQGPHKTQ